MRESIAGQIKDLFYQTIVPAFGEDMEFENKAEYDEALALLETLVREEMRKYVIVITTDELKVIEDMIVEADNNYVEFETHVREEIETHFMVPKEFL